MNPAKIPPETKETRPAEYDSDDDAGACAPHPR